MIHGFCTSLSVAVPGWIVCYIKHIKQINFTKILSMILFKWSDLQIDRNKRTDSEHISRLIPLFFLEARQFAVENNVHNVFRICRQKWKDLGVILISTQRSPIPLCMHGAVVMHQLEQITSSCWWKIKETPSRLVCAWLTAEGNQMHIYNIPRETIYWYNIVSSENPILVLGIWGFGSRVSGYS